MRKLWLFALLFTLSLPSVHAQDSFSGIYHTINQAQYDSEKRWIEISRNKYQEIIVNSEYYSNAIAYYDSVNKELFFVIEKPAGYNTLMKIRFLQNGTIELYMLAQGKWSKSEYVYQK